MNLIRCNRQTFAHEKTQRNEKNRFLFLSFKTVLVNEYMLFCNFLFLKPKAKLTSYTTILSLKHYWLLFKMFSVLKKFARRTHCSVNSDQRPSDYRQKKRFSRIVKTSRQRLWVFKLCYYVTIYSTSCFDASFQITSFI